MSDKSAKAKKLWEFYQSRQRTDECEPTWVLWPYSMMRDYGGLVAEDKGNADTMIGNLSISDGTVQEAFPGLPGSPLRIIHEGCKIGTPSWVFMGRNLADSVVERKGDLVICGRKVPRQYRHSGHAAAWIAYSLNEPMGSTALTSNVFGPCLTRAELEQAIRAEAGL